MFFTFLIFWTFFYTCAVLLSVIVSRLTYMNVYVSTGNVFTNISH